MKKHIAFMLAGLFSLSAGATDSSPVTKSSIELTGVKFGRNTLVEKFGNNINVHFVHFNALTLRINQGDYTCHGTRGAGIHCKSGITEDYMDKPESLKDQIQLVDTKIGSNYIFENISSLFNTKFIQIDELILKLNGKDYTCGGAGGQIRCHPIMNK